MKVIINSQDELIKYARDLTHLVANLRHAQKEWQEYYGADLLNKKKAWEKRVDTFIDQHNIETTQREFQVEIKIDKEAPVAEEKKQVKVVDWNQDSISTWKANLDGYLLSVIKMDDVSFYWEVIFDNKMISYSKPDSLKYSVTSAKGAATYQMTKHKAQNNKSMNPKII